MAAHPNLDQHSLRYLLGSVICTVINNLVLIVSDTLRIPDLSAVIVTWAIGGSVGYAWHRRVTFAAETSRRGYFQFMAGVALGIPLTYFAILLFHVALAWPMWLAAPAATLTLIPYNYLNARFAIVFRSLLRREG